MTDDQPMRRIVIVGTESELGRQLADMYNFGSTDVVSIALTGQDDLENIADFCGKSPISLLIFADGRDQAGTPLSATLRSEMRETLCRLTYIPFRLATLLRPALAAACGSVVLLTRTTAQMERPDEQGRFSDRPLRAAAHALWRCLSIEWREDDIGFVAIALSNRSNQVPMPPRPDMIEAAVMRDARMLLVDGNGVSLPW